MAVGTTAQEDATFEYTVTNLKTNTEYKLHQRPYIKNPKICYQVTGANALGRLSEEESLPASPFLEMSSQAKTWSGQKTDYESAWMLDSQTVYRISFPEEYNTRPFSIQIDHPAL
jgi:hypothetical protein